MRIRSVFVLAVLAALLAPSAFAQQASTSDAAWLVDEFRRFSSNQKDIDECAAKVAFGADPNKSYPVICERFATTHLVQNRAKKLRAIEAKRRQREADRLLAIDLLPLNEEGKNSLRKHEIWIGATADMAVLCYGKPEKINKTITEAGTSEQWVYSLDQILYVESGVVRSIQLSH
jgi:hypothetical protein